MKPVSQALLWSPRLENQGDWCIWRFVTYNLSDNWWLENQRSEAHFLPSLPDIGLKLRRPPLSVSRTKNQFADALATLASMISIPEGIDIRPIEIEVREDPAYCLAIEEREADGKPWFHDIKTYLEDRTFPPDATATDRRTIQRLAAQFFAFDYIRSGTLSKKA